MRKNKVKLSEILDYSADEIEMLLIVSESRAKEIHTLAGFYKYRLSGSISPETWYQWDFTASMTY